jgi:hypothetical protein
VANNHIMNKRFFDILLNKQKIGTTELEKADAPMGVVFGQIIFSDKLYDYAYFKAYCSVNNIEFIDISEDNFISTGNIPVLQVLNSNGNEIKGLVCIIEGADRSSFEITIEGIAYPFYQEEFPDHVKAYGEMHKDQP